MPLIGLSWGLIVLLVSLGIFVVLLFVGEREDTEWKVVTTPADKLVEVDHNGDYGDRRERIQISNTVLVRVKRGRQTVTIASLNIGSPTFDEDIHAGNVLWLGPVYTDAS